MYALIYPTGVVANLVEDGDLNVPDGWSLIEGTDNVQPGWTYDGNQFSPPPEPPEVVPPTPLVLQALRNVRVLTQKQTDDASAYMAVNA